MGLLGCGRGSGRCSLGAGVLSVADVTVIWVSENRQRYQLPTYRKQEPKLKLKPPPVKHQ